MTWDDIVFFKKSEFTCRCGCRQNKMDLDFVSDLDHIRSRLDYPLIVSSGYRCPEYNNEISTTGKTGPHTTGHAADFALFGAQAFDFVSHVAMSSLFGGIGLKQHGPHNKRFIHLDNLAASDGRFRPTIWTYS